MCFSIQPTQMSALPKVGCVCASQENRAAYGEDSFFLIFNIIDNRFVWSSYSSATGMCLRHFTSSEIKICASVCSH